MPARRRGAADLELAGELAFGREAVAGVELAGGDQGAHMVDDLHGELAVAAGLVTLPLSSCALALHVCVLRGCCVAAQRLAVQRVVCKRITRIACRSGE